MKKFQALDRMSKLVVLFMVVLLIFATFNISKSIAGQIMVGEVAGTGAAINVAVGWNPSYVKLINQNTGAEMEWFVHQPALYGLLHPLTGGPHTLTTTDGISTYAGTTSVGKGFTIGANSTINAVANTISWMAVQ